MGMSEGKGKLAGQHLSYLTPSMNLTEKEIQYLNSCIVIKGNLKSKFPTKFIEELPGINKKPQADA